MSLDEELKKEDIGNEVKIFLSKYDFYLDEFCKSNDLEYQEKLFLPLIVFLVEIQKEKYDLDCKIITGSWDNNTLGSYEYNTNTIYINTFAFESFEDKKEAFVRTVNTVFHEIRHAVQYREIKSSNAISYDNLLYAIDMIIYFGNRPVNKGYYFNNYKIISFEQDARDMAYTETMKFFKDYEDMQEYVNNDTYAPCPALTSFVRKADRYTVGLLRMFRIGCYEWGSINEYPVIKEFFNIDNERYVITPKSEEYFMTKLKELEGMEDSLLKRESIYSIKMFLMLLKVDEYMKDNYASYDNGDAKMFENDSLLGLEQEIIENVGVMPGRSN